MTSGRPDAAGNNQLGEAMPPKVMSAVTPSQDGILLLTHNDNTKH